MSAAPEWSDESEDLFRSARRATSPTEDDRARVRAGIAAKIGAAAAAGAAMSATSKAAAATTAKGASLGLVAKIAAPIVIVGAATAAAPRVLPHLTAAPAPIATTAATAAPRRASTRTDIEPQPATAVSVDDLPTATLGGARSEEPRRGAPAPRESTPSTDSEEEAALVGAVDAALRSGDATRAAQLASEHERRFPRGALVEEREGARVIARCMAGAGASSGAERFLAAHPRSPLHARILAACGTGR